MDLSAKVLREVEFRERLRGYDGYEVDEFLEKVAVEVEDLQEKMRQLVARAERAERAVSDKATGGEDDSISRTLLLAQRAADLAVNEAQEQAVELVESARREAEELLGEAREGALHLTSEAERRHTDDIARLEAERDKISRELRELSAVLEATRKKMRESLSAALSFVEGALPAPIEVPEFHAEHLSFEGGPVDDIEAQISEDAAVAAPSVPPDDDYPDDDYPSEQASLSAVPPLGSPAPVTESWRAESMPMFPDSVASPRRVTPLGSDWIA
ncbi:MAG: DivIVA domain-containing protein [Acidimicrobiales bacterium]|jgi:cell division initiation protein